MGCQSGKSVTEAVAFMPRPPIMAPPTLEIQQIPKEYMVTAEVPVVRKRAAPTPRAANGLAGAAELVALRPPEEDEEEAKGEAPKAAATAGAACASDANPTVVPRGCTCCGW
mmetsp:Transcript_112363/g.323025  ORF Transcript_112363/g.323025 Transcript_112363/m.323025 type:complete len:112 (+) Transcript_112363:113-448(+)